MLLHCQQGGAVDNPNLEISKDSFKISSVLLIVAADYAAAPA
jgi:hypothetical protein